MPQILILILLLLLAGLRSHVAFQSSCKVSQTLASLQLYGSGGSTRKSDPKIGATRVSLWKVLEPSGRLQRSTACGDAAYKITVFEGAVVFQSM
jgi:hypothetical protein